MKNLFLVATLILASSIVTAQKAADDDDKPEFKYELSTNVFDLVVAGSLNVDFEYLMKDNQSLLIGVTAFDTYGYFDAGFLESTNAVALRAGWVIYTSRYEKHGGFHFYPMLKLRVGEVTADYDISIIDDEGNFVDTNQRDYNIGGFSAGFGLGYKWVVSDKFTISTNFELTRNLGGNLDSENADLGIVEPRFGVIFGYRF